MKIVDVRTTAAEADYDWTCVCADDEGPIDLK